MLFSISKASSGDNCSVVLKGGDDDKQGRQQHEPEQYNEDLNTTSTALIPVDNIWNKKKTHYKGYRSLMSHFLCSHGIKMKLSDKRIRTVLLHPGKNGGGYIHEVLHKHKICIQECHPFPCSFAKNKLYKRAIVPIRDPVDRFISSFYYVKQQTTCPPKLTYPNRIGVISDGQRQSHRERQLVTIPADSNVINNNTTTTTSTTSTNTTTEGLIVEDDSYNNQCIKAKNRANEWYLTHVKYLPSSGAGAGDIDDIGGINKLAENLCPTSSSYDEASNDVNHIRHMQSPLIDWIPLSRHHGLNDGVDHNTTANTTNTTNGNRFKFDLFPIVLEDGYDFKKQIKYATLWAVNASLSRLKKNNDTEYPRIEKWSQEFAYDLRKIYYRKKRTKKTTTMTINNGQQQPQRAKKHKQRAQQHKHTSKTIEHEELSELSICCITRYYQRDYELILELSETICKEKEIYYGGGDDEDSNDYNNTDSSSNNNNNNNIKKQICQQGLQSIYNRRKKYLIDTSESKSCQEIVSLLSEQQKEERIRR